MNNNNTIAIHNRIDAIANHTISHDHRVTTKADLVLVDHRVMKLLLLLLQNRVTRSRPI